jgi:PDZ domain
MKRILLVLLALFVLPSIAQVNAQQTLTIPAGTAIRIRTTQPVSSDTARVGDDVAMEVLADVAVDNYVVIRQGSPVIAVVSVAKEAKRLGRRGHVAIALKYVESVTGEHVLVSGSRQEQGSGKKAKMVGEVVATALLVSPAGSLLWLLEKGNDSMIQPGTAFTVYAAGDVILDLRQLAPGTALLRARPSGPQNLPVLGIVVDANPTTFLPTVIGTVKGGPADKAGIQVGYLITAVNRVETNRVRDLVDTLAELPPNATTVNIGCAFPNYLGYMPKEISVRLRP